MGHGPGEEVQRPAGQLGALQHACYSADCADWAGRGQEGGQPSTASHAATKHCNEQCSSSAQPIISKTLNLELTQAPQHVMLQPRQVHVNWYQAHVPMCPTRQSSAPPASCRLIMTIKMRCTCDAGAGRPVERPTACMAASCCPMQQPHACGLPAPFQAAPRHTVFAYIT